MLWTERSWCVKVRVLNECVLIGNNIGVEGCRIISEMLKKDSRLVGLNLLGEKEGYHTHIIIEMNQFEMIWEKKVTGLVMKGKDF